MSTTLQNSELTLGWYHPGFIRSRRDVITSTEHRRRLYLVDDVANGLIGATLLASCIAGNVGKPIIEPESKDDHRGWRRVHVSPELKHTKQGIQVVRQAIGEASLVHDAYIQVRGRVAGGNEAVQTLLTVAEEVGMRNPIRLLEACPAIKQTGADSVGNAPPLREEPHTVYPVDANEVFGLLPDLEIAIRRAISNAAVEATHPEPL
jgi:hypothetical protein